jgi:cyclic pyranopterin phosphate synthase
MSSQGFTHLDPNGQAQMVDVGAKPPTARIAVARATIYLSSDTLHAIADQNLDKGEVLQVARLAGIMAAKRTDELIPLCHSLGLEQISVRFALLPAHDAIIIEATARCTGKTGVEMEALVAAQLAALTIYDMCKARDRALVLSHCFLYKKSGGRSGDFVHPDPPGPAVPDDHVWR